MSETEVTYLFGVPHEVDPSPTVKVWYYEKSVKGHAKFIVFDHGKVGLIACQSNCPPLAGIQLTDTEEVALEKLKGIVGYEFDESENVVSAKKLYGWFTKDKSGEVTKNIEAEKPPVWLVLSRGRVALIALESEEFRKSRMGKRGFDTPRVPLN
jgi:hypothetical protein